MQIKHLAIVLIPVALITFMVYSSIMKIHSYYAGVTNQIPDTLFGLEVYKGQLEDYRKNLDQMTFEQMKGREKDRLNYEIKMLNAVYPALRKLKDMEQLKG